MPHVMRLVLQSTPMRTLKANSSLNPRLLNGKLFIDDNFRKCKRKALFHVTACTVYSVCTILHICQRSCDCKSLQMCTTETLPIRRVRTHQGWRVILGTWWHGLAIFGFATITTEILVHSGTKLGNHFFFSCRRGTQTIQRWLSYNESWRERVNIKYKYMTYTHVNRRLCEYYILWTTSIIYPLSSKCKQKLKSGNWNNRRLPLFFFVYW